jgi:DNA-directed RNA polymerase specialized sigma24 family protein
VARQDIPMPGWAIDLLEDRGQWTELVDAGKLQLLAELPTLIDGLGEPHRSIIEAVFYEGLSRQQLADRYDVRPHVIQTWTRQAVRSLKEGLALRFPNEVRTLSSGQPGPLPVPSEVVRADRAA